MESLEIDQSDDNPVQDILHTVFHLQLCLLVSDVSVELGYDFRLLRIIVEFKLSYMYSSVNFSTLLARKLLRDTYTSSTPASTCKTDHLVLGIYVI